VQASWGPLKAFAGKPRVQISLASDAEGPWGRQRSNRDAKETTMSLGMVYGHKRPRSASVPPKRSSGGAPDDWLRELFSGTYDLREADTKRRMTWPRIPPPKAQQTER
jgi:hypothetical protein